MSARGSWEGWSVGMEDDGATYADFVDCVVAAGALENYETVFFFFCLSMYTSLRWLNCIDFHNEKEWIKVLYNGVYLLRNCNQLFEFMQK